MLTPGVNLRQFVLMIILFYPRSTGAACTVGWFGPKCQYKCLCQYNRCEQDGECQAGVICEGQWFGPKCQFWNVLNAMYGFEDVLAVLDKRPDTCTGSTTLRFHLSTPRLLSWIRLITISDTAKTIQEDTKLEVSFKDDTGKRIPCSGMVVFNVNKNTTDIMCSLSVKVIYIKLDRGLGNKICEMYASGGQNLALKQLTNQTNEIVDRNVTSWSHLVVDGAQRSNCTEIGDGEKTWSLIYDMPVILFSVVAYVKGHSADQHEFTMTTYSPDGTMIALYSEIDLRNSTYEVYPENEEVTSVITITISNLSLCEVETMARKICSPTKWGFECANNCTCPKTHECSPITGVCGTRCLIGFYGPQCTLLCPSNCANKYCTWNTGDCYSCVEGFVGDKCDIECAPNNYGPNCSLACPSNCRHRSCNNDGINSTTCSNRLCHEDGMCYRCSKSGFYGFNCSLPCSKYCKDVCDVRDGTCTTCLIGFYGKNCSHDCGDNCKDECDFITGVCKACSNYYGINCSIPCPSECEYGLCHYATGACLSECLVGFYGAKCENKCKGKCRGSVCDKVKGTCLSGCVSGFYGETCTYPCPEKCNNSVCDFTYGYCFACQEGLFGAHCSIACAANCEERKCNIETGFCSDGNDHNVTLSTVAPFIICAILCCGLIAYVLKKDSRDVNEESSLTPSLAKVITGADTERASK